MRMGWAGAVAVGTLEEDRFWNGFRVLHGFWIASVRYCEVLHRLLWQDGGLIHPLLRMRTTSSSCWVVLMASSARAYPSYIPPNLWSMHYSNTCDTSHVILPSPLKMHDTAVRK
jgi:hypothetical protein